MSTVLLRSIRAALMLAFTLTGVQAADVVMKSDEVTEQSLIEALQGEQAVVPGGKRRGFKLAADSAAAPSQPARTGRASLLITFDTNSAVLSAESLRLLDTVARALRSDKLAALTFRVEGHADPRGLADANQRLSQHRAEAVVADLVTRFGIPAERLQPVGKGSSELLDTTRPDAPENRRVTIVTNGH